MCGRFSQAYSWEQIHAFSQPLTMAAGRGNLQPRYNIAPTTTIDIIVHGGEGRELRQARWGLVPLWWKKPLKGMPATFNARVETVDTSPMFRDAFKRRRCIIPASGFFEWTGEKGDKTPHYFSAADGELLAFAGLWERWTSPEGEEVISATMVVRDANEWTQKYHDRMPSMLHPADFDRWLDGSADKSILREPPPQLQEWIVSQRVNKTGQGDDDPTTVEPITSPPDAEPPLPL
jgi:putative SOS response-associated peptidase YedK